MGLDDLGGFWILFKWIEFEGCFGIIKKDAS
jgi:hypothetical protein